MPLSASLRTPHIPTLCARTDVLYSHTQTTKTNAQPPPSHSGTRSLIPGSGPHPTRSHGPSVEFTVRQILPGADTDPGLAPDPRVPYPQGLAHTLTALRKTGHRKAHISIFYNVLPLLLLPLCDLGSRRACLFNSPVALPWWCRPLGSSSPLCLDLCVTLSESQNIKDQPHPLA